MKQLFSGTASMVRRTRPDRRITAVLRRPALAPAILATPARNCALVPTSLSLLARHFVRIKMRANILNWLGSAAFVAALLAAPKAQAAPGNLLVNGSFEKLPAGGLPFGGCGTGCSYSEDSIPGWVTSNPTMSGQIQPGSSSGNFAYFDYVPDGLTVAYTNGGSISQTVGATAIAGDTYTLSVDLGVRHDYGDLGTISLDIGSHVITATGTLPAAGTWSIYTATYTATPADAGSPISAVLGADHADFAQGDWDNAVLTAAAVGGVPEPASWGMMLLGLGIAGGALRRRRAREFAAI